MTERTIIKTFKCANCGKEIQKTLGQMEANPFLISLGSTENCPDCGGPIPIDTLAELPNFKFDSLLLMGRGYADYPVSDALKDIASIYTRNLDRVVTYTWLFSWLRITEGELSAKMYQVLKSHGGELNQEPLTAFVDSLKNRRDFSGIRSDFGKFFMANHFVSVDQLIEWRGTNGTKLAIESIIASILIGTWTAFESLVFELWIKAVNLRPNPLASLTGTRKRISSKAGIAIEHREEPTELEESKDKTEDDSDEDSEAAENSKQLFSLRAAHRVTEGSYNLGSKMGELLVTHGNVGFTKLKDIREAYSMAFSEKHKNKPGKIDDILCDKSLDALALVRNLLVHKAGIADGHYVADSKNVPGAPKLEIGEELWVDGENSRALMEPVIMAGLNLLGAVDKWLNHQTIITSNRKRT